MPTEFSISKSECQAGAQVTLVFNGMTYSGVTDSNGTFRTDWIKNLNSGNYNAEVTDLVMADFDWNHLLDLEDDDDVDGLPDRWFAI